MAERTGIIDILRDLQMCSLSGSRVVDIIYGTDDMTKIEFEV